MYPIVRCDECGLRFNETLNTVLHYGIRRVCPTCEAVMVAAEEAQKSPGLTRGERDFLSLIAAFAAAAGIVLLAQAADKAVGRWLA